MGATREGRVVWRLPTQGNPRAAPRVSLVSFVPFPRRVNIGAVVESNRLPELPPRRQADPDGEEVRGEFLRGALP